MPRLVEVLARPLGCLLSRDLCPSAAITAVTGIMYSEQPAGDVDVEPLADRASLEDLCSHEDPECDQNAE
jgi:hypothetical protein